MKLTALTLMAMLAATGANSEGARWALVDSLTSADLALWGWTQTGVTSYKFTGGGLVLITFWTALEPGKNGHKKVFRCTDAMNKVFDGGSAHFCASPSKTD